MASQDPALPFVKERGEISIADGNRPNFVRRFKNLQNLVHALTPRVAQSSPAAMQLVLLRHQKLDFTMDPGTNSPLESSVSNLLRIAARDLQESIVSSLENSLRVAFPFVYISFESYVVLSLLALKPGAPITHYACNEINRMLNKPENRSLLERAALLNDDLRILASISVYSPERIDQGRRDLAVVSNDVARIAKELHDLYVASRPIVPKREPKKEPVVQPLPEPSPPPSPPRSPPPGGEEQFGFEADD